MDQFSFVFTIFFMLLGPVKIIPAFAGMTRGKDNRFQRAVAIRAALIASAMVAVLTLGAEPLLGKYRISIDGVRIAGSLVLFIAALNTIFPRPKPQTASPTNVAPIQLAASPLATPIIVTPAGVAAILIFMMLATESPGIGQIVGIALAVIMVLDFLVMYFNSAIMKVPGLVMILQVLGAVLIFIQAALAVEVMLIALRHLGVVQGPGAP